MKKLVFYIIAILIFMPEIMRAQTNDASETNFAKEAKELVEKEMQKREAIDELLDDEIKVRWDEQIEIYKKSKLNKTKIQYDETDIMEYFKKKHAMDKLIEQGSKELKSRNYEQALNHCEKAISIDPYNVTPYLFCGDIYYQKGMVDKAITLYKQSLTINPYTEYCGYAYYKLGIHYCQNEMWDKCISHFKMMIIVMPNMPKFANEANRKIGLAYLMKGFKTLASDYLYKAGLLYLEEGNREEALKTYECLKMTQSKELEDALFARLYPTNGIPSTQQKIVTSYTGTGFAISRDGLIVTACHLVQEASSIKVYLHDNSTAIATIQTKDPLNDIAIIKIKTPTPTFLPIAPSRSAKTGDRVFTIGFPISSLLGQEAKYTEGVISSLSGIEGTPSFFQITVPIQPGNSGGPLVNEDGYVVGIISLTAAISTFLTNTGTLPQNVNWAVKADYLRPLIDLPLPVLGKANRQEIIERTKNTTFLIEVVN